MKKYIPIILALISINFQNCAQTDNWQELLNDKDSPIHQYDIDFIKYVMDEKLEEDFKNQDKFKFLNSFQLMSKINDESLLVSQYMKKPNENELLSLYLKRKMGWNFFNRGSCRKDIIYDELKDFPNKDELLSFYYSEIFIQVLNKKETFNPHEINLDYKSLDLNKKEGDIMFLTAMRHCGSQIISYSKAKFPNNCFRQISFVSKLPSFNGMKFDEYQLDEFKDFLIHVDKRYPKTSFKERYVPEFEGAKIAFIKCQEVESTTDGSK